MESVSYVVKPDIIQVLVGRELAVLTPSHPMFDLIRKAILENKLGELPKLVSLSSFLSASTDGQFALEGGSLFYRGKKINPTLEEKILSKAYSKNIDGMLSSVASFKSAYDILGEKGVEDLLKKLKENPNKNAEDLFYDWLTD